jgi:hypothetical protein
MSCDKVVRLLGIDIDYHISCDKVVRLLGIDIDYHISCDTVVPSNLTTLSHDM